MGRYFRYTESQSKSFFDTLCILNFYKWNKNDKMSRLEVTLEKKEKSVTFFKDRNYRWSSIFLQTKRKTLKKKEKEIYKDLVHPDTMFNAYWSNLYMLPY